MAEHTHAAAVRLHKAGRLDEALALYEQALEANPGAPEILANMAALLRLVGRTGDAVRHLERALAIHPEFAPALATMSVILIGAADAELGLTYAQRAASLAPSHPGVAENLLMAALYAPHLPPQGVAALHMAWGQVLAPLAAAPRQFPNARDPDKKLRVGYVSPDLRDHAVGQAIAPVFAGHDRDRFHIILYGEVSRPDHLTDAFMRCADAWRSTVGVSDEDAVSLIKADGIDILVDLAGHTDGNRLGIFARRAAPIQVTWHGYPATTGLKSIDYRMVDEITDPPGDGDELASEKLVRLADGFIGARPRIALPQILPPPVFARNRVTFGCFNNFQKINRSVISVWARLLRATPGSQLLLKSSRIVDDWTFRRYAAIFRSEGIDADRLIFLPWSQTPTEHLSSYAEIDIALDPFPYNGTSTTMEALMMGVPVVTLLGASHVSRVGASILTHIGRPEWVARTTDSYVAIAAELAQDKGGLARVRSALRDQYLGSRFADPARLARAVEAAYREMWRRFVQDDHPAAV
jgi:predicted O-linked N-acetylglucosamine transferase (SPINDLY family)